MARGLNMKCYQKLNLPVSKWVKDDLDLSWFPTLESFGLTPWGDKRNWSLQYPPSNKVLSQEAIDFLDKMGIMPSVSGLNTVNLFRGEPNETMHIHLDPGPKWSLNFVFGNTDSEMVWYNEGENVNKRLWTSTTGRQAMSYDPEGMIEIARCRIDRPTLVKINTPHNVFNYGEGLRWAVCVKDTTKSWTFDEAAELLKEYWID